MSLPDVAAEDTRPTKPCQKFEGHTNWIMGVIPLPSGQQIMTSSYESLRVWNLQTGEQISHWEDENGRIRAMALSVDGKKIVSGSDDGVVRLWSIEIGRVIAEWTGHTSVVRSMCWNGDGERVLSGSQDGTSAAVVRSRTTVRTGLLVRFSVVRSMVLMPARTGPQNGSWSEVHPNGSHLVREAQTIPNLNFDGLFGFRL